MSHRPDRRTDHVLRARIDQLLGRVHDARLEIVERGLTAARPAEPWATERPAPRDGAAGPERHDV
jgi:hypothetical protein